jgi:2-polyprenyl-3-methyl-5-hydroxy-6-metoxy-1,4-benzoquinol methylase
LWCGTHTSRELARRGGLVVGIDLSERLICLAEEAESSHRLGITHRVADITALSTWWDDRLFDGAVCEMAFMDIDDLADTVAAFRTVLSPAGALYVSIVNPCFPGNEAGVSSWPPDRGYSAEGYWTSPEHNPDGVRIRVGSSHRTLGTYLNTFLDADFVLERVREPKADLPTWLVLAFRSGE